MPQVITVPPADLSRRAFDEAWKVDAEGDVGAYWGLWDKDGKPKYW